jgi:catechol 2,3-dioxygenase-like lactoylglutathione lyase family enzyme
MKLVPIVYVTDMERSLAWYRTVLPEAELVSTSPYWSELSLGDAASLALHGAERIEPGNQVGLSLAATEPLEQLVAGLAAANIAPHRGIADEAFGRSVLFADPDGLVIQVNEHDAELYPRS